MCVSFTSQSDLLVHIIYTDHKVGTANIVMLRVLYLLDYVSVRGSLCRELQVMHLTPEVVASDVDVKMLDIILLTFYTQFSSLVLKVYPYSPECGVMRLLVDIDVLGYTSEDIKGKKY